MSRTTFNRSIDKLIKVGLAYKNGNIVHLKSKKQITEEFTDYEPNTKKKIRFLKIDTTQCIRTQIQLHRLKTKFKQIKYASVQKKAQNKSAREYLLNFSREASISVPNSVIAKALGKSKSAAHYSVKKLENLGLLEVVRHELLVVARRISLKAFEELKKVRAFFMGVCLRNCFWINGNVIYCQSNEYKVTDRVAVTR